MARVFNVIFVVYVIKTFTSYFKLILRVLCHIFPIFVLIRRDLFCIFGVIFFLIQILISWFFKSDVPDFCHFVFSLPELCMLFFLWPFFLLLSGVMTFFLWRGVVLSSFFKVYWIFIGLDYLSWKLILILTIHICIKHICPKCKFWLYFGPGAGSFWLFGVL